jgi:hypothetical protein
MPSRRPVASLPALAALVAMLVVALLVGACSSAPVSQVRTTALPSTASVASPSEGPASEAPGSEAPPAPTDAPAGTPPPGPTATPGIPPKPAKVTFKRTGEVEVNGAMRATSRLTWTSPEGVASSFTVYGVKECLRTARKFDGKPCVVKGMRIPKDTLQLLATVPGTQRSVDLSWKVDEVGPGPYHAVLIRASNAAGDSIFTIAWSAKVCAGCTY